MIELHNIDCMEYMKTCKDNQFSLAIVDVPYGIGADNNSNRGGKKNGKSFAKSKEYGKKDWDNEPPKKKYFNELKRISKNQIIFGANHFIENISSANSSCWIVWDKDNGDNDYADCELAFTSFKTAVRKFRYKWHGMLQENMKNKEIRQHPTQKPVALYKWLLHNYAKEGDTIFDSHSGSLSIGIACHDMKYDLTACELDKDYFEAGKLRLETHQRQNQINYDVIEETIEKDKTLFD